jgi:hypothetical protein
MNFTGGRRGNRGMAFPLITRISADGMLEHPRPSARSAEKSVLELDLLVQKHERKVRVKGKEKKEKHLSYLCGLL